MLELRNEEERMAERRTKFKRELLQSVYGVKSYVNAIKEDVKGARLKPKSKEQVKIEIEKKRTEL